jgi:hypothetical protein
MYTMDFIGSSHKWEALLAFCFLGMCDAKHPIMVTHHDLSCLKHLWYPQVWERGLRSIDLFLEER